MGATKYSMNRTIRHLGKVYGPNSATITAVVDGQEIFSGTLPTSGKEVWDMSPDDTTPQDIFFTHEIPIDFAGKIPVVITVHSGYVLFGDTTGNYFVVNNPVYTQEEHESFLNLSNDERLALFDSKATYPFTDEEKEIIKTRTFPDKERQDILVAHGVTRLAVTPPDYFRKTYPRESRANVVINGEKLTREGNLGSWAWSVDATKKPAIFTFDMIVDDCLGECTERQPLDWNNVILTEYS